MKVEVDVLRTPSFLLPLPYSVQLQHYEDCVRDLTVRTVSVSVI